MPLGGDGVRVIATWLHLEELGGHTPNSVLPDLDWGRDLENRLEESRGSRGMRVESWALQLRVQ